jgi:hypothetical protein
MKPTRWINGALLGIILLLLALIASRFRSESSATGTNEPAVARSLSAPSARNDPAAPAALNRLNVRQPGTQVQRNQVDTVATPGGERAPAPETSPLAQQATAFRAYREDAEPEAEAATQSSSQSPLQRQLTGGRSGFSRLNSG